jgi:beta-galactosidase GanA
MTPPARRSAVVDELERRYLDLHEGDREAAARNLAVDLMMIEARSHAAGSAADPAPDPATLRRFQRAAIKACGVLRLPMAHAMTVYADTVEYARDHLLPGPSGNPGTPITRWEAAALTTRRAA